MHRSAFRRLLALILATSLLAATGVSALAQTSASTGVSVEYFEAGEFSFGWVGSGDVAFLVDGQAPTLNATTPSVTATATFTLTLTDSRSTRPGYTIAVRSSAFTQEGTDHAIPAASLSIESAIGQPAGSTNLMTGATLDNAVTLITVAADANAVNVTITITVAIQIGPGVPPGEYSGTLTLEFMAITG